MFTQTLLNKTLQNYVLESGQLAANMNAGDTIQYNIYIYTYMIWINDIFWLNFHLNGFLLIQSISAYCQ